MMYLGDFPADQAIYFAWNTNDGDGASITRSGDGTISVYKDASNGTAFDVTQVTTGITNDEDFDGLTGMHTCCITTTNAWYETGHDYLVVLSASTIDTQTVNAVIAHFSIENRFMRGTDSAALAATALSDATWTAAKAVHLDANISSRSSHTAAAVKTAIEAAGSSIALMLADTNELQGNQAAWATATGFSTHSAANVWAVAARVLTANTNFNDLNAAAIKAEVVAALADIKLDHLLNIAVDTDWGTTVHLDSVIGHMADVGTAATFDRTQESMEAIRARGDAEWVTGAGGSAPTVGEIRTEMEGVGTKLTLTLEDTADLQGNQSAWATATGFSTHSAANVWSVASRILTANTNLNDPTAAVMAAAVWDKLIADHTGAGSFGLKNQKVVPSETIADYKATGFSTHAAADIWAVGTRALTDKSGFALSATGANLILKDSTFALAMADAIWDEILSGTTHNIATSAGRRVREIGAFAIHGDTAQSGTTTSITLATAASSDDGIYNRNLIAITEGTGAGQTRQIADYDGTTKVVYVDREWRVSPDNTSVYQITANNVFALVDQGNVVAATATTVTLRPYASSINDTYLYNQLAIISGTGRGQSRLIGGYNGTTKVATICGDNWVTIPDTTSVYVMMPYGTTCTSCIGTHALSLIKSEADDALTDIKLDHLIAVADGDDPVNDSIIAQMAASDGDWSGFAKADDALEAIRDRGDSAWTTATSVTVSDKTGFALSEAGIDAILDENIEGTHTFREMMRLIGAYAAGKSSGGGTATITFRDIDDTKDRIVATVTSVGNRTAVTLTED